jgi:hypothetical protein
MPKWEFVDVDHEPVDRLVVDDVSMFNGGETPDRP